MKNNLNKRDRYLNRKINIEYIKRYKIKKLIKINLIGSLISAIFHIFVSIESYKFDISKIIGTVFGLLILLNLFLFLISILKTGIQWSTRCKKEEEKFKLFVDEYMSEILSNNDISQQEYERFYKINSK